MKWIAYFAALYFLMNGSLIAGLLCFLLGIYLSGSGQKS